MEKFLTGTEKTFEKISEKIKNEEK